MRINLFSLLSAGTLLLGLASVQAALMSIDFGTEWMKIALVKPGVPFDIVLNRDSKRKTQTVIAIRGTERTYSSSGQALGMRFPKDSFCHLKLLLGQIHESPNSLSYRKSHWVRIKEDDDRKTPVFTSDNGSEHSLEGLVAMLFQYARDEAKTAAGEDIKDVVITVPPFFNQFEREAILDAAHIAGLKVLTLINDGSAVALNYAMTRKFTSENQHHIIYDMGSGNTVATLVNIKEATGKEGKYRRNVTYTQVEVLGVAYDQQLGGIAFEEKLQGILFDRFASKHPQASKSLLDNPRSILKLQKEALRVKHILSANTDAHTSIEGLHDEADLKTSISRAEFEEASHDLFARSLQPVKDALKAAKLSIDDINSIILFGGSTRIPKVLNSLKEFAGSDKISQNVNGDESAALGATFRGAALSSQFKVKDIRLKELNTHPIELIVAPEGQEKGKKLILVEANSPMVDSFFLPIKTAEDFDFVVQYPDSPESPRAGTGCHVIAEGQVRGVKSKLEKFQDRLIGEPKIRVLVNMSPSGTLSILKAQAVLQLKVIEEPSEEKNETAESEPKKEAAKQVTEKVNLDFKYSRVCFAPLTKESKDKAIQSIRILNDLDMERFARDEARNKLESFVYSTPDYLDREEVQTVSTPEERTALQNAVEEASEWLTDSVEEASKSQIDAQLSQLEKLKKPIVRRLSEYKERPAAIESLRTALTDIDSFCNLMTQNLTTEAKDKLAPTIENVHSGADKTSAWLIEQTKNQDALPKSADPVLLVKSIKTKQRELEELKFKLMREIIALPPPPPPKPETTPEDPSATNTVDAEPNVESTSSSQQDQDETSSKPTEEPTPNTDEKDEL